MHLKLLTFSIGLLLQTNCNIAMALDHQSKWDSLKVKGDRFERGEIGIQPDRVKFDAVPSEPQVRSLKNAQGKAKGENDKRLLAILRYTRSSEKTTKARNAFILGCRLQSEGKYKDAIDSFNTVIDANPFLVEADYNAALCHQLANQPKEAILGYRRMVLINPKYSECWRRLAETHHATGNEDQALECLKKYYEN